MRVKQDVVPRRYTYAWFFPTKPGTYRLTCAEYCGTNHSQMACLESDPKTGACLRRAVLVVHQPGDYERYLADKAALTMNIPPEQLGKMLYEKKGCIACHTIDGSARVGPSFFHDFGTMVPLKDGRELHPRVRHVSAGQGASRLPAVDAILRGPAQRKRDPRHHRLPQVAEVARAPWRPLHNRPS
jgi:hypothetical protein